MMDPLHVLPPELVALVVHEAEFGTLLGSRLTCRTLCQEVTPLKFNDIFIWFEENSLQKLKNNSKSPHLQHHLNTFFAAWKNFTTLDLRPLDVLS